VLGSAQHGLEHRGRDGERRREWRPTGSLVRRHRGALIGSPVTGERIERTHTGERVFTSGRTTFDVG
jgi:hypothetical protein